MGNNHKEIIHKILKDYWGYDRFRPLQEEIILSVLNGDDTLALLPTGGGKSVCFQIPALALQGLCVVVSPLIALMKDQVANLKAKHIKATAIYSGMSTYQIQSVIQNVLYDKDYRFLYVSPERLQTKTFKSNFKNMPVVLIAVDEAHCISQWGYDFRPPYLEIARIRQYFPHVPVLALTATATPEVVKDIQKQLQFKRENVFQKSFRRDNLTYYVAEEEDKNGRMLRIMQRYPGSGIVYVRNRKRTAEVADFLSQHGITADFYHAGLDTAVRDQKQNDWINDKTRVIVATNAFGMGIDKPDVRFVVHINLPDSIEAYFQEAGRAGRDEKPAVAILLYDRNDLRQLKRNFTLSFPPLETIRQVYAGLCQHYTIALGTGKNNMYPFYIGAHAREMKMNVTQYWHALQFLEKAGVIALSEHLRDISQIRFRLNGDDLLNYEQHHEQQTEFIKLLLRSYSGVFTDYVRIEERLLAYRGKMTLDETVRNLQELHRNKVIYYQPQSKTPLLIFVLDRVPESYLYFDPNVYAVRKGKALARMQAMEQYVTTTSSCRSRQLLAYFGETKSKACSNCDVCLKIHRLTVSNEEFKNIADKILTLKNQQPALSIKKIFEKLSLHFEEEKIVSVMRWLTDHDQLK